MVSSTKLMLFPGLSKRAARRKATVSQCTRMFPRTDRGLQTECLLGLSTHSRFLKVLVESDSITIRRTCCMHISNARRSLCYKSVLYLHGYCEPITSNSARLQSDCYLPFGSTQLLVPKCLFAYFQNGYVVPFAPLFGYNPCLLQPMAERIVPKDLE